MDWIPPVLVNAAAISFFVSFPALIAATVVGFMYAMRYLRLLHHNHAPESERLSGAGIFVGLRQDRRRLFESMRSYGMLSDDPELRSIAKRALWCLDARWPLFIVASISVVCILSLRP